MGLHHHYLHEGIRSLNQKVLGIPCDHYYAATPHRSYSNCLLDRGVGALLLYFDVIFVQNRCTGA